MLWNGVSVDLIMLRRYLDQSQTLDPIFGAAGLPSPECALRVDEVLVVTKRAHIAKMSFAGNEAFSRFLIAFRRLFRVRGGPVRPFCGGASRFEPIRTGKG